MWMWPWVPTQSAGNQTPGHASPLSLLVAVTAAGWCLWFVFFYESLQNGRWWSRRWKRLGSWCCGNQEGSFCTCSGCFDLQSVLPAVEKKHLLMSLLCISSVLTVGPGCWGKQSYSWVAPQPLSTHATTCGCPLGITHLRERPRVCRTVSLETAYPICKHSTTIIHLIERNSWKWLKSLLVGQSQPLCQTVPSATILHKHARECVRTHKNPC